MCVKVLYKNKAPPAHGHRNRLSAIPPLHLPSPPYHHHDLLCVSSSLSLTLKTVSFSLTYPSYLFGYALVGKKSKKSHTHTRARGFSGCERLPQIARTPRLKW
mmetsp:Transcript_8589/g.13934  ORF Transcript_8589/g.13934 Transcript_8589/m.13934 type:complete len:103 (-) Transcript_8589:1286-1594(-)